MTDLTAGSVIERTIPYLGNKSRYLASISDAIDEIAPSPSSAVIDPFTGSGSVARHLSARRTVFASDIQEYSRVLLAGSSLAQSEVNAAHRAVEHALIRWSKTLALDAVSQVISYEQRAYEQEDVAAIAALIEVGSLRAHGARWVQELEPRLYEKLCAETRGLRIFQYYGGVYFSYADALLIDAVCAEGLAADGASKDALLALAIHMATQLATTVGGHFAQPIRPRLKRGELKPALLKKVARSRRRDSAALLRRTVDSSWRAARTFPIHTRTVDYSTAIAEADVDCAVVYADPPYTRDHYSRFYHVLETIARGDEPGITKSRVKGGAAHSRGLYRTERHQSPFSIPAQAPDAFSTLFEVARSRDFPVVVSYSPRYERLDATVRSVDLVDLERIAASWFGSVEIRPIEGSSHAQFNRRDRAVTRTLPSEVLLIARL